MQPAAPPSDPPTPRPEATPPTKPTRPGKKYVTYHTKRLGAIRVPDVPLPYFAVGESKTKRPPMDVGTAFEEVKVWRPLSGQT